MLGLAEVAPHDPADLAKVQLLGERRGGRDREQRQESVQLPRRAGQELAVGAHHLLGLLERPERGSGQDGADGMQSELERGDDAEVAAAAADRPEQVGVLLGARTRLCSVGEHDVGLEQIVDRQAVAPRQVADPAAERQPADAGGRDEATWRREAVRVRGLVDLTPGAATADSDGARLGVHLDRPQQGQVRDDSVVANPEARAVVPAAAHRQRKLMRPREADRTRHVLRVCAARDQRRAPIDHRVVDLARVVVVGVLRREQPSRESSLQLLPRRICRATLGDHVPGPSARVQSRLQDDRPSDRHSIRERSLWVRRSQR